MKQEYVAKNFLHFGGLFLCFLTEWYFFSDYATLYYYKDDGLNRRISPFRLDIRAQTLCPLLEKVLWR